ncbi:MAG TPA: o-succinylbenzoate synthase [Bacteroidia bacterium]|nr:o-succinylbenzoate synthase [Bacteroidia bacterium]
MRFTASVTRHTLRFKTPARTSRNTLADKTVWLLHLGYEANPAVKGIGECGPLSGLSIDDVEGFEDQLNKVTGLLNEGFHPKELGLEQWPSIRFGLETALLDLENGGKKKIFDTPFYTSELKLPINGLVWMAPKEDMLKQAEDKIAAGYTCVKFKVGAIDFDEECRMLEALRKKHSAFKVEIRLDANGAFSPDTVMEHLNELKRFEIHSIEQPIRQGQWDTMAEVCAKSKIPVALDEELIGVSSNDAERLMKTIRPPYIILKPGLLGGFEISQRWILLAGKHNAGWWITSALESNVGLNAIAQFTSLYPVTIPQGLGTGQLYENNFESPLKVENGYIFYQPLKSWDKF